MMFKFHRYHYGGLEIHSPVAIRGLQLNPNDSESGTPVLTFDFSTHPLTPHRGFVYVSQGRYGLRLWKLADGWIFGCSHGAEFQVEANGHVITCHPGPCGWDHWTEEFFTRRVLPRVAQLLGRVCVHGAAATTKHGAVLLVGPSRAGKSTLAAFLAQQSGWQILADDAALLTEGRNGFLVFPAGSNVCLWSDSHIALSKSTEVWDFVEGYETKRSRSFTNGSPCAPQPLRGIYHLEPNCEGPAGTQMKVATEDLAPSERVVLLARQLIRFDPTDGEVEVNRLAMLVRLASSVPVKVMRFPRRYEMLSEVEATLAKEINRQLGD